MGKSSQNFDTSGHEYNREQFMVLQYLKNMHTCLPVKVLKAYPRPPGSAKANKSGIMGVVDVKIMVEQIDNEEKLIETNTLYCLPYFRAQGGICAFVVDPEPGDYGFALFCERDISKFKRQQIPNVPDTYRMFDQADGLYVGGILNKPPKIYVQVHPTKGVIIEGLDQQVKVNTTGDCFTYCNNATVNAMGSCNISGNGGVHLNPPTAGNITAAGNCCCAGSCSSDYSDSCCGVTPSGNMCCGGSSGSCAFGATTNCMKFDDVTQNLKIRV